MVHPETQSITSVTTTNHCVYDKVTAQSQKNHENKQRLQVEKHDNENSCNSNRCCRQLLSVQRALLNDFCDAFVAGGNPQHDDSRFTGFHFVGNLAHFLGAETPKFWIVQFARGHRSTVIAWSPPYLPCALGKVMLSINFDIAPKVKWASTDVTGPANVRFTPESGMPAYDSRPTGSDQPCQKTRDAWCMAKMHTEELIACRRSGEPQHPLSYLCIAPTYSFVSLRMLERYSRMLVRPPSRALEHAGWRFLSRHLRVVMAPATEHDATDARKCITCFHHLCRPYRSFGKPQRTILSGITCVVRVQSGVRRTKCG